MANPNIDLLGAVYPTVAGVTLPTQGGGTATFPWVEGSQTITQNGTVDVTNLAEVVVNVSGGGGASNIVTGTFKGTTTGAAMDVNIPYTGSGYPIALHIYPTEGAFNPSGTFYNTIQRYAITWFTAVKTRPGETPDYTSGSSNINTYSTVMTYKSSATSATSQSASSSVGTNLRYIASQNAPSSSNSNVVKMPSAKKMSVYIASTSYGFAANIEYTYHIIYSS